jgi:hypothetical protein
MGGDAGAGEPREVTAPTRPRQWGHAIREYRSWARSSVRAAGARAPGTAAAAHGPRDATAGPRSPVAPPQARAYCRAMSDKQASARKKAAKSRHQPAAAAQRPARGDGGGRAQRLAGDKTKAKTKASGRAAAGGPATTKLLVAMTGKASAAKAAVGDGPVFAYIASLPQPQRGIAERIDALAARTLPGLQRAVKWGMAYYGVDGGWCFASGAFVGHVKLMFIRGTDLKPEPPVTPIGMGKLTRGVEPASVDDLDERQTASWMKQAATMPFVGGRKR